MDHWIRRGSWTVLYRNERRYRPSVVAIACVLASRRVAGINPILSDRIKEMSLLEECYGGDDSVYEEIGECYEIVCNQCALNGTKGNSGANSIRGSV